MKPVLVIIILIGLSACGGGAENGDAVSSGSMESAISGSQQVLQPGIISESRVGSEGRAGPAQRNRFDENGNIVGVYGVPYIPEAAQ